MDYGPPCDVLETGLYLKPHLLFHRRKVSGIYADVNHLFETTAEQV